MAADGGLRGSIHVGQDVQRDIQGPLRPSAMSKVHPIPSPDVIRQFELVRTEMRITAQIVQYFPLERIAGIHHFMSQHHSIDEWVSFHNSIAIELMLKPLFVSVPPEVPHDMTYDVFASFYAPEMVQPPEVMMGMFQFFRYVSKTLATDGMN